MNNETASPVLVTIPVGYTLIKTEEYAAMVAHNISLDHDCSDSAKEIAEATEKLEDLRRRLLNASRDINRMGERLDHFYSFLEAEPYAKKMLAEYEQSISPAPGADYAETEES